jgi:hypothetical protein
MPLQDARPGKAKSECHCLYVSLCVSLCISGEAPLSSSERSAGALRGIFPGGSTTIVYF